MVVAFVLIVQNLTPVQTGLHRFSIYFFKTERGGKRGSGSLHRTSLVKLVCTCSQSSSLSTSSSSLCHLFFAHGHPLCPLFPLCPSFCSWSSSLSTSSSLSLVCLLMAILFVHFFLFSLSLNCFLYDCPLLPRLFPPLFTYSLALVGFYPWAMSSVSRSSFRNTKGICYCTF